MSAKRKRRVSGATLERLRELRRKHGLGEFRSGNAVRRPRRSGTKPKAKRTGIGKPKAFPTAGLGYGLGF